MTGNDSLIRVQQRASLLAAVHSVRSSLCTAPVFILAVAGAAGLGVPATKAWAGEYERLGRMVGTELGREVGGSGAQGRIAAAAGALIIGNMARPADEAAAEERRLRQIDAQARERGQRDAVRDAAYEAKRRELDPNYDGAARQSDRSNETYRTIAGNLSRLDETHERVARQWRERNR
jgi:hypothetical protein